MKKDKHICTTCGRMKYWNIHAETWECPIKAHNLTIKDFTLNKKLEE